MKRTYITLCLALMSLTAMWGETVATSPDGRIVVDFEVKDGRPMYSVLYDGQVAIAPSAMGLHTNMGDYTSELAWNASDVRKGEFAGTCTLPSIKVGAEHSYLYSHSVLSLSHKERSVMEIEFMVSNRDVAFRYTILPRRDARCCVVTSEATSFCISTDARAFLAPQSYPMGGFARTTPSYETKYGLGEPVGRNGWGNGYTFPCLFEVPHTDEAKNLWILISETGTDGTYVGCRLLGERGGRYRIGFPMEGEMNGWGSTSAQMALPGKTPWRTITIGHTPANAIETTVPWDLVEEKYPASRNYSADYGKGMWSWIIGMDYSCNFNEQKRYIDFAAAMGYRSLLIDALWDVQIGRERIAQLSQYARSKGVGLYLWYNSNGAWNDAPQSPRGIMNDPRKRRAEMKWMQEIGVLGIKVDFFGGDKQPMMQFYEDILTDANDFGIMCIFHGCTLPRGWERMYPNYVSSEAVPASENLHFSQGFCNEEARDCGAMYPFTRNAVGAMDFGGSALNKFYNANNRQGSRRITSDIYALATAVLFQSPVQHFALAPNNLSDAPGYAMEFMKSVPTQWDEVRYIDGYPGQYVILARRSGNKWYIAGVNAMDQPIKHTLFLPMLKDKFVCLYINGEMKTVELGRNHTLKIEIPTNGGVVVVGS